jgi:hypothetical protein
MLEGEDALGKGVVEHSDGVAELFRAIDKFGGSREALAMAIIRPIRFS